MSNEIKPCKCGYAGALQGMRNHGFLTLACPECSHSVDAFTMDGLAAEWNKSVEPCAEGDSDERPCRECGERGCNGECYGDDMMGDSA